MRRLMVCLAAASMVVLCSVAPASAKTQDSIELVSATSFARGAAVGLVYSVTCRPGYLAQLGVQVSQRHGKTATDASAAPPVDCTGQPQQVSALLLPHPGQRPFRHRAALISAQLGNCSEPGTCTTTETQTTVRLKPGTPPAGDQGPDHLTLVSATTVAHGAAVQVVVDVTCRADGLLSNVSAVISQRVKNTTTQGSAIAELTCTVSRQRFTLHVAAQTGQPRFRPGRAVLGVGLVDCLRSGDCPVTNVWLIPRLTKQPVT
jgi:hypothetical protein